MTCYMKEHYQFMERSVNCNQQPDSIITLVNSHFSDQNCHINYIPEWHPEFKNNFNFFPIRSSFKYINIAYILHIFGLSICKIVKNHKYCA